MIISNKEPRSISPKTGFRIKRHIMTFGLAVFGMGILSHASAFNAYAYNVQAAAETPEQDWTKTVNISKFGGFTIGNPDAETRISEYVSYTCSHCADFEQNQAPILKNEHVKEGNITLEIRNLIRDPLDLTIAILARCGGKDRFFDNHAMFMREQPNILQKASTLTQDQLLDWKADSIGNYARDIMNSLNLDQYMLDNGYTAEQVEHCITDKDAHRSIAQMTLHATLVQRVSGTPGFVINDEYQPSIINLQTMAPYLNN